MKKPSIQELQKEIASLKHIIEAQDRDLREYYTVEKLIIAAGLVDEDKFNQARELLNKNG